MHCHKPLNTGLAVGLTWGVSYLLCALVTALFPSLLPSALGVLVHGLNVSAFQQPVPPTSVGNVALGAAFFTLFGLWVGALYAVLSNALGARRGAH